MRRSLIVYAARTIRVLDGFAWPGWAADRTPPGSAVPAGGPICTVLAQGAGGGGPAAAAARARRLGPRRAAGAGRSLWQAAAFAMTGGS